MPLSPRITFVPVPPVIVSLPCAADDDRLARADRDLIVAAVGRVGRDDCIDVGRIGVGAVPDAVRIQARAEVLRVEQRADPGDVAVVAEHEARARAGRDVSLPTPPKTTELPEPIVIVSSSPMPAPVVCTRPSVIGSVPNGVGLLGEADDLAAVAEDDVGAGAARDGVACRRRR